MSGTVWYSFKLDVTEAEKTFGIDRNQDPDPGFGGNIPDHISESLETVEIKVFLTIFA